ncbi:MAG: M56 family peptidase [Calditrichaeota bacterium]|nr:MAG: M56 family peptidase [Calditrichota bacterium]
METLSQIAEAWWPIYRVHFLEVSLFILLIYGLDRMIRMTPGMRYFLWLLPLAKMFIPPTFSLPQSISPAVVTQTWLPPISAANTALQKVSISWSVAFFCVWLLTVVLVAFVILFQNLRLARKLRNVSAVELPEHIKAALRDSGYRMRVLVSDAIQTPVLTGFRHPRLVLPADFLNWTPSQARGILAHELAHLEYRDMWTLGLQNLGLVLFAANPLVWLMHKKLIEVRELRCDATAIQRTGIAPMEYSKLLYQFLEKQTRTRILPAMGNYFAETRQSLLDRFQHLLDRAEGRAPRRFFHHYVLLILAAGILVPFSWQCSSDASTGGELMAVKSAANAQIPAAIAYDQPPMPIGGFSAIQQNLKYPNLARLAGIEGKIILNLLIKKDGTVADVKVLDRELNASGDNLYGLKEAAITAVKSVPWRPAMKDHQPVSTWVGIPVVFNLAYSKDVEESRKKNRPIPPPPEPDIPKSERIFVAYDSPPQPIGGFAAVQRNLHQLMLASTHRKQSRAIINVLVTAKGKVKRTVVLRSTGDLQLDELARAAIMRTRWKPASQKGTPVEVWVGIPVIFP